MQLSAPGAMLVDNNLAQMSGSADLFLRGDLATPVLYGEVTIDEGGTVVESESQLLDPRIARLADDESTSAAGFLYGQAAAAIGDRVSGLFGLDKLRIDPLKGSDRESRAAYSHEPR